MGDTLESVVRLRRPRDPGSALSRAVIRGRSWGPCTYAYVWARDTDLTVGGPAPSLSVTL